MQKIDSSQGLCDFEQTDKPQENDKNATVPVPNQDANPEALTAPLRLQYGTDFGVNFERWPSLPEHIKAAIMALVGTVKP